MNLYKELLTAVQNGGRFKIDFSRRTLSVNGKQILSKGAPVSSKYTLDFDSKEVPLQVTLRKIERAYSAYRHSIPGEKDNRRTYFYAPPYYHLDKDEQLLGESRNVARFRLEFRVLMALISGRLYWDPVTMGEKCSWFWRSDNEPELIILRAWIKQ